MDVILCRVSLEYMMEGERIAAQFVADNLHSDVFEMLVNSSTSITEKAIEASYIKTDQ